MHLVWQHRPQCYLRSTCPLLPTYNQDLLASKLLEDFHLLFSRFLSSRACPNP